MGVNLMLGNINLSGKDKLFTNTLLAGFLFKYNYLLLIIFYIPSYTSLIIKNVLIIITFNYFLEPMVKRKKGRRKLLFLSFVFTVFFISNYWYNSYFGNYVTINDLIMGEGVGQFSMLDVLIKHIVRYYDAIFIFDLVILSSLLIGVSSQTIDYRFKFIGKHNFLKITFIIIMLFSQIFVTNKISDNPKPVKLYQKGAAEFVNVYGIIPLYFYEFLKVSEEGVFAVKEEQIQEKLIKVPELTREDELDSEQVISDQTNVIVIQVESLDAKIIDYQYQGSEVTPFLNQLKEKSLYFENFYAQKVNGSFDADLSFLTSVYPVNSNYAFQENNMLKFDSLARYFKKYGYQTLAFHGNNKEFFYRSKAFPDLGFDEFISLEDFSEKNMVIKDLPNPLGINDYDFFNQSLDYLKRVDEPFFSYFITLTSHTPFDYYPPSEKQGKFSDINSLLVHNYFQSIAFLDKSLEMFFAGLKKQKLLDNTLVVIYADHESGINRLEYSSNREFKLFHNVKIPQNIPLILYHPALEADIVNKPGTIADLAPTILDLFGAEKLPNKFVGNSLLTDEENPLIFMHENPQVLYQGQLFVRQDNQFKKIGYLEKRGNKEVDLSNVEKKEIGEIIYYMRNVLFKK